MSTDEMMNFDAAKEMMRQAVAINPDYRTERLRRSGNHRNTEIREYLQPADPSTAKVTAPWTKPKEDFWRALMKEMFPQPK